MEIATKQDFDAMQARLDQLTEYVSLLSEKALMPDVVYLQDIARVEGLSVPGLKKQPWLIPNFGESEYPGHKKWKYQTFRQWRNIPVMERKSMWDTHIRNNIKRFTQEVTNG